MKGDDGKKRGFGGKSKRKEKVSPVHSDSDGSERGVLAEDC